MVVAPCGAKAGRADRQKDSSMEILSILILALEERGCQDCLVGSIHEAIDAGNFARVSEAISWAQYMCQENGK